MLIESGAFIQTQTIIPCLWILTELEQDRTLPLCKGLGYIIRKIIANYQHIGLIYETLLELIMKQLDDSFQSIFSRTAFSEDNLEIKFSGVLLVKFIDVYEVPHELLGGPREISTPDHCDTKKVLKLKVFSNNSLKKQKLWPSSLFMAYDSQSQATR